MAICDGCKAEEAFDCSLLQLESKGTYHLSDMITCRVNRRCPKGIFPSGVRKLEFPAQALIKRLQPCPVCGDMVADNLTEFRLSTLQIGLETARALPLRLDRHTPGVFDHVLIAQSCLQWRPIGLHGGRMTAYVLDGYIRLWPFCRADVQVRVGFWLTFQEGWERIIRKVYDHAPAFAGLAVRFAKQAMQDIGDAAVLIYAL